MRLDTYLRERMGYRSRHHARQEIKAGSILVNGETVKKPSFAVNEEDRVETRSFAIPYVSFGGVKLTRALASFAIDLEGRIVLDVGASTGGFTDCALQRGAKRVYAVDVGKEQFADKLKADGRVVLKESTNFLDTEKEDFPGVEMVLMDVSFTSNIPLLCHMRDMFEDAVAVVLFKPQFEGANVSRSGIVKNERDILETFAKYLKTLEREGFHLVGVTLSPRQEERANREIFVHIDKRQEPVAPDGLVKSIAESLEEEGDSLCSDI